MPTCLETDASSPRRTLGGLYGGFASACFGSVLACGDEALPAEETSGGGIGPPEAELRYATKYIDIAPLSPSFPLCAGTLAMLDDQVEYVMNELELPLEERITMYLFDGASVPLRTWCGQDVAGCAAGTTIYSTLAVLPHEIVHAVTASAGRSWWEEGAARGLGDPATFGDPIDGWKANLGGSGHLSRWLIERFGGAAYMELYARTRGDAAKAQVEAAVRTSLGREFDDILDEYAATAPFFYPHHWECYRPLDDVEVPWGDNFWQYEAHLDCERANTFSTNVVIAGLRMTARIPVTIPANGAYWFVADHPDASLALQPCAHDPGAEYVEGAYSWPIELFGQFGPTVLKAGPHVLQVHLPPGSPATVRVVSYPDIGE